MLSVLGLDFGFGVCLRCGWCGCRLFCAPELCCVRLVGNFSLCWYVGWVCWLSGLGLIVRCCVRDWWGLAVVVVRVFLVFGLSGLDLVCAGLRFRVGWTVCFDGWFC